MIFTTAILGSILSGAAKVITGIFSEKMKNEYATKQLELRVAHQDRVAELEYRRGRNEQIAVIQGQDTGWSSMNIVRVGFAAPFVVLVNIEVWYWMVSGEWMPLDQMPEFVWYTGMAVLNFTLLAEVGNAAYRQHGRNKLMANPEVESRVEAEGARRRENYMRRVGRSGVTGQ